MKLTVVSMNKRHYLEKWCDCNYNKHITLNVEYTLNCISDKYDEKYRVILKQIHNICPSGYRNCTYGEMVIKYVENFGAFNHDIKKPFKFDLDFKYDYASDSYKTEFANDERGYNLKVENLFTLSTDGCDMYYPSGYVSINEDLFEPNIRYINKPIIYIFNGESATGKSYLAEHSNKIVFETDSCDGKLPDEIIAEIIVNGNKNHFSVSDIIERIKIDAKIIVANFESLT